MRCLLASFVMSCKMDYFIKILVLAILCQLLSTTVCITASQDESEDKTGKMLIEFRVERIETDLKLFTLGAAIDFSYNETLDFPGDVVSSPGCPKSHEGRPRVYYGSPPKCFLVGFRGPCHHGKRIFSVSHSKYGVCNCECFAQEVKISRVSLQSHSTSDLSDYSKHDVSLNLILRNRQIRSQTPFNSRNNRQDDSLLSRLLNNPMAVFNSKSEERRKICNNSKATTTQPPELKNLEPDNLSISSYSLASPSKIHNIEPNSAAEPRYNFCYSNWYKRQVVYDSLRQECTPFLDQGPCQNGEWLVRNLDVPNGVTCERRKCPEIQNIKAKPDFGGSYTYFDYRRQSCLTEVYGNLQEQFFSHSGGIFPGSFTRYCRDAGMRYSQRLKTCVRDLSKEFKYKVIG